MRSQDSQRAGRTAVIRHYGHAGSLGRLLRLKRMRGLHLRTGRGGRCATLAAAARGACRIHHSRYGPSARPERHTLAVDVAIQVGSLFEEPAFLNRPEPCTASLGHQHDTRRLADRSIRLGVVAILGRPRISLAQALGISTDELMMEAQQRSISEDLRALFNAADKLPDDKKRQLRTAIKWMLLAISQEQLDEGE